MNVILELVASLSGWEWILMAAALTVIAVLLLNLAVELCFDGCYRVRRVWRTFLVRRELHREDRRHADPFHVDFKIARELERLANRAGAPASAAGAGRVSASVGSLPNADAARGNALLAELTGHSHEAAKLDRETDYGRGTTLIFPAASAHRVRPEPWLAGRDLA